VIAGIDGEYSISAPSDGKLQISFLGYESQEIGINGRTKIDAILAQESKEIDDVVVVGYGAIRKRDVTGAISSVSSSSIEERIPIDVFDALQGQTAGVQITSGSGAPGEGSSIRIRGTATFGEGVNPLYVVDGVPMDNIDDINPADVESVEVLKDAASAAIYGSRSANGVVLITTKIGDKYKPQVSVKYLRSWSKMSHKMPQVTPSDVMSYYQIRQSFGLSHMLPNDPTSYFNNANTDYQDELFETATRDEINLSSSGGSDNMKYYLSAGYLQDRGVIRSSDYNRLTSRINIDYNATRKLLIGSRVSLSMSRRNGIDEANLLSDLLGRNASWQLYNPDGSFVPVVSDRRNPVAQAEMEVNKKQMYKMTYFNYLTYTIFKDLKFTTNITGSFNLERSQFFRPSLLVITNQKTYGTDQSILRLNYSNENYFNYAKVFNEHHNFSAMLGASIQWWDREDVRVRGEDYSTDEIYTISAASTIIANSTTSTMSAHSMASFFSRVSYDYKGRYLVSANIRRDGSSRFGEDNRWGTFPSISVGWRFSDESFFSWSKPALRDGKLRVSYGVTGNEYIDDYDAQMTYSPGNYYMGVSGIAPSRLTSSTLGWEQTSQTNVGLDLRLLKNRLRITTDYYYKVTTDLLYNVQIPKETGYSTVRQNVGSMKNTGIEFMVDYDVISNKKWKWNVSFNIATNTSTILKLAEGTPFFTGTDNSVYIEENEKIGNFWGRYQEGIFAYDESNAFDESWRQLTPVFDGMGNFSSYVDYQGSTYTGTVNQKLRPDGTPFVGGDVNWRDNPNDTNGIGIIDDKDIFNLGNSQANFFGGVNTTVSYNRFSLFVSFFYSFGGDIYNNFARRRNSFQSTSRVPEPDVIHNIWTQPGDEALYPRPEYVSHNTYTGPTNMWIEDGSYIKLRTVKLSYDLRPKYAKKIFMEGLSAYVYANNLLTWTAYKGYDPEFSTTNALTQGIDTGKYPRKREFGFGFSLKF
jgi:TonB-linked SusC/RagA family outer membrane protein